jgi:hypothetical protein
MIGVKLSDPVNAKFLNNATSVTGQARIKDSPKPDKPTQVAIDPVSSPAPVDPSGDINQIHTPATIVIEDAPTLKNVAIIKAVGGEGEDPDQLVWYIKNVKENGDDDPNATEVRAEFWKPDASPREKNQGDKVFLTGKNPGRIRLEVRFKEDGDNGPVKETYEAWVDKLKILPVRINLLKGTTPGKGTKITDKLASLHLMQANIYLRQAGILALQDAGQPNPKTLAIDPKLVFEPPDDRRFELLNTNAKTKVAQISYIQKLQGAGTRGICFTIPGNTSFQDEDPKIKLKYRIVLNAQPEEKTMDTIAKQLLDDPDIWGVIIGDGADTSVQDNNTYAMAIAHELGHLMNLRHRSLDESVLGRDGLGQPDAANLMSYGGYPTRGDFDLIQTRVMRFSKALVDP